MKKTLLVAAVAVAASTVGASAFAATKFGNPGQQGSLLIFPRVEAETHVLAPGPATLTSIAATTNDTLVHITNDGPYDALLQCYWGTTRQLATGTGGNIKGAIDPVTHREIPNIAQTARGLLRQQHSQYFDLLVKKGTTAHFWAGDLEGLKNGTYGALGFNKLSTIDDVPQFNFFPNGEQANEGDLKCWVGTTAKETKYNFLSGKATVYTFASPLPTAGGILPAVLGEAHEYNAWAFQRLAATGAAGELKLDGKEYDQCPMALTGSFIPSAHTAASLAGGLINTTNYSLSSCNQHLDGAAQVHLLKFGVVKKSGQRLKDAGNECIGAWAEGDLGEKFTHFTYGSLISDVATFRVQTVKPTSTVCNADKGGAGGLDKNGAPQFYPGKIQADVVEAGLVGIQVNSVGGFFQSSSTLVGVNAESAKAAGYYESKQVSNTIQY